MSTNNYQILQQLQAGTDVRIFTDPLAIQIAKFGLMAVAIIFLILSLFFVFRQMGLTGATKISFLGWVFVALSAFTSFAAYSKSNSYAVIDDAKPVLIIAPASLTYDVRRDGWVVSWRDMEKVIIKQTVDKYKQSTQQVTNELQLVMKAGTEIKWLYPASEDNNIAASKKLYEKSNVLIINPEPLGIGHDTLQSALERYRADSL